MRPGAPGEHLDDYRVWLTDKDYNVNHVYTTMCRLKMLLAEFDDWRSMTPERIEAWLLVYRRRAKRPIGINTANAYVKAIKSYVAWLIRYKLLAEDPIRDLVTPRGDPSPRYARRALTADEVNALLDSAHGGDHVEGLTGLQRYWLYRFAVETGLRRGEIASTQWHSFDWKIPAVTVDAAHAKSRETRTVPLRKDTAKELRKWIGRRRKGPMFSVPDTTGRMIRRDLKIAGVPFETKLGRADFHSLRHTFGTNIGKVTRSFWTLQALLGHKTPAMSARYSVARLASMTEAVEAVQQ